MSEHHDHQLLRAALFLLAIALASESGVRAAGHGRKTVSGSLAAGSRTEPSAEGTVPASEVEYVNSGPLGPLYDFLIQNRLQRLCLMIRKANLEPYLVEGGIWTIFAPTDGSFAFLPGGTLEELEKNPRLMRDFLLYHFVSGDLAKSQIIDEMVVDSVQGSPLRFNIYGPVEITTVSGAEILQPDLQFELGRVHIIDRPLYPLPQYDLMGYLQVYHNEMYKLVISSGLSEFLTDGTFTIFAPDDKAFNYLSYDLKDALATNETLAQRVVLTHVLPASMFVRSFGNDMHMNSVGNADLLFTQRRGLTFVNGVPILTPDIPVINGVIHVVNRVLLPEGVDADCQCKPLDSKTGAQIPGRPYESARIPPATRPSSQTGGPVAPAIPQVVPPVPRVTRPGVSPVQPRPGISPVQPRPGISPVQPRPGISPVQPRPGISPVQPRPGISPVQPRPGISLVQPQPETTQVSSQRPSVKQPIAPGPATGQRTTTNILSGHGQRPSISDGVGLGQRQVSPPTHRPAQPIAPAPVTIKRKPFDPNRIPQGSRPTSSPSSTRTQRPWNPPGDTILIELKDEYEPLPTDAPDSAAVIPGTIPAVIPPRTTVVSRPGTLPGTRFPSQPSHQTRQPAHSTIKKTRQPSVPSGRPGFPGSPSFEDNTVDVQTGYPEYDYEPLTQRPGYVGAPQPGRRPGQPDVSQTVGLRPGQPTHPGQQPGQSQLQPTQRPGQYPRRPGQQTGVQHGTWPGQSPVQRPGQQTQFQPGSRPRTQIGSSISSATQGSRRPVPSPPTQRTPVPSRTVGSPQAGQPGIAQPTSAPRQQFVTSRATSLFPTRRPGQTSHSTKGQTYNPQRHNPQRRPINTQSQQISRQTINSPAGNPGHSVQPFESNRQPPSCRRRGERVTPATQTLPLCPEGDVELEPCQRVDQGYDPSDPRPPCQENSASCYTPGEHTDSSDSRPPCPSLPDQPECRQPGEIANPTDYRPLCPQTGAPNCRMPLERPIPGDRRPLCTTAGRPAISPAVTPQRQSQRPGTAGPPSSIQPANYPDGNCRPQGEPLTPGDRRPTCGANTPHISPPSPGTPQGTGGNRGAQPGRQPSFQPVSGNTICRQPGERITPGDRRPLCRTPTTPSRLRPGNPIGSEVLPPTSENETQEPVNCRPVTERPTIGDTRPVCRIPTSGSRGQRPISPQATPGRQTSPPRTPSRPVIQQRPSPPAISSQTPGRDATGPSVESPEGGDPVAPEQPPSTEFIPHQPNIRPPSQISPTTRRPATQHGHRGTGSHQQRPWLSPVSSQTIPPDTLGVDDQVPPGDQWNDNGPVAPVHQPVRHDRPQQSWQTSRTPTQPTAARRPATPITRTDISLPGITTTTTLTTTRTSDGPRTLYEIVEDPALLIQGRPVKLTKIFELFKKADLEYILLDPGRYTVFLPSDDAFLRLPKGVVEQLESDPNLLQQVLLFHISTEEVLPAPQEQSYFIPSLQGTPVLITMLKGGRLILISGAKAVAVTRASNGIFYVVNQLIYPLPQDDIVSALSSRPDLKTVTTFIQISGLDEYLRDQPYTLFAPSDNAFNQLSEAAVQELMQNTTALRDLLLGHVIAGAHYGREFLSGASFPNMRGETLRLNTVSYGYQVNDVNIKTPEIVTGGGVIHVIDEVLLTPEDLRFIERLSNALDGGEKPLANLELQTTSQSPATPVNGQNGRWRTHSTITVTYGRTSSRTEGISGAGPLRPGSPYPQTGAQPIIRGTLPAHGSQGLIPGISPQTGNHETVVNTQTPGSGRLSSTTPNIVGQRSSSRNPSPNQSHSSSQFGQHSSVANQGNHASLGTSGHGHNSIVQLANDIGLNRFASLITNSGLTDKIQDGGTYTVLAPTDEALNALPPDVSQALEADPNQLRNLLQYHILPQKLSPSSLGNDETASTLLEGQKLRFNKYSNGQVLTALGVPVDNTQADQSTSVRIIPVSQVLQPPSGNLLKVIENTPELSELYNAVKNAHVSWMLTGEGGVTLFAPSNLAFESLTEEQRKDIIENRRNFNELLKSHLVRGTLYTTGLQDGEQRRTENRKTVTFNFDNGVVLVNTIPILHSDIPATNGVLHIIDLFL